MRRAVKTSIVGAAAAASAIAVERRLVAAPRYRGPASDHFDGERFHNIETGWHERGSFLKWMMTRDPGFWPEWVDDEPGPAPLHRVPEGALRVTFINHATLLIQLDGINILTDPIWSERTAPLPFIGPRRHRAPGIRFDDLPPIDIVLVSHNHYDHLDIPTLRRLQQRDRPRIVTPLGNGALMRRHGVDDAIELDWWQASDRVTVVPARHFSARGLSDRNRNLWGGFVIHGAAGSVYFAGDTGWGAHFAEIGARFAPIRAALLPIGAYLPRWFMRPAHVTPAEAVDAHAALRARTSIPMHYGTFALGDDGIDEPLRDLQSALAAKGSPDFAILDHGEGRELP